MGSSLNCQPARPNTLPAAVLINHPSHSHWLCHTAACGRARSASASWPSGKQRRRWRRSSARCPWRSSPSASSAAARCARLLPALPGPRGGSAWVHLAAQCLPAWPSHDHPTELPLFLSCLQGMLGPLEVSLPSASLQTLTMPFYRPLLAIPAGHAGPPGGAPAGLPQHRHHRVGAAAALPGA